jgi:hypothetical protein
MVPTYKMPQCKVSPERPVSRVVPFFMHAILGFRLGIVASLPAGDAVVTPCAASMFAVGSGITGFILTQVERGA